MSAAVRHGMSAVRVALPGVLPARPLRQRLRNPLHSLQGALPVGVPTQKKVPLALLPTLPALPETLPQEAALLAQLPGAMRRGVRVLRL